MRLPENAEWVQENFGGCCFGHVKRTTRLKIVAANMLERPEASLPQQNREWSDLKAAYRLCDRPEVTFDSVSECHWKQTRQTSPGRYLLISDTTDLNHYTHSATTGLGFLGDGAGRGLQLHSCMVVDSVRSVVEGLAGALTHYRRRTRRGETRTERLRRPRESELWRKLVEKVGPPPDACQWIHVFDRGGDNFESLCQILKSRCDWVIRAAKLNRKVMNEAGEQLLLNAEFKQAKELGCYELKLRSRPGQAARTALIRVCATRVTVPRPVFQSQFVKACGVAEVKTNVVTAEEVDPPPGVTAISWVLLTSLPVNTFEDALQVIQDYECRWLIEEYHKVLKTGCRIERHALRTAHRLEALTGLISVIGIRLLQLKTFAKQEPESKARNRVPALWIQALLHLTPRLRKTELTTHGFFRELAKLGGFLGRKHDGEPGWQTIWHGYLQLQLVVKGMEFNVG